MISSPYIEYLGRVLQDSKNSGAYMDWSLTGFDIMVEATQVAFAFEASNGIEPSGRFGAGSEEQRPLWPIIGVLFDDQQELSQMIMIDEPVKTVTIHLDEEKSRLTKIRVIKLTENIKSGLKLINITCDGTFLPVSKENKPVIEIVGDSITCGFGNISPDPNRGFYAEEENAYLAYGAVLSRKLGMEPRVVASSGLCLAMKEWNGRPYAIRDLYEYTDRPREDEIFRICPDSNTVIMTEELPTTKAQLFDFKSNPADIVLINLGTNDADGCNYYDDPDKRAQQFRQDYLSFLKRVRELNGTKTKIVCTLGDMRYYLWEYIKSAIDIYQAQTGDDNIYAIKLHGIKPGERRGAGLHPSVDTDLRMAEQLLAFISSTVK